MSRFVNIVVLSTLLSMVSCSPKTETVKGDDCRVTYVGRTDYSVPGEPRQWAAGAYFTFAFDGTGCELNVRNEYGFNYIEVIVDTLAPVRIALDSINNHINIGRIQSTFKDTMSQVVNIHPNLVSGYHQVMVVRDTETGHGYTQVQEITTTGLQQWEPQTTMRMEFIGNSITCGAEAYCDLVPYGEGRWGDRHMAYMAYGPRTARALNAQWSLTSVSGIGLIHSCCNMDTIIMPRVYDTIALREGRGVWDFSYQPDVVCCCLGQNDGIQDVDTFRMEYVGFVKRLRGYYPEARIVLLGSPMANEELRAYTAEMLPNVVGELGDEKVTYMMFSRSWNSGGGEHPDVSEHALIAEELTKYLKELMNIN